MKLYFKKIILHNFLSYKEAEIILENKNYCLVSGINNCSKDNSISNGSGKSSWISAISFVLTGETIQGIHSDLKNIYVTEDECWVELHFNYNLDNFIIKRINRPKSDLKIYINGEDKSGKGIRDSELLLASYIPDLNRLLLNSVILLGQGLPEKISSFSPSGRKQFLEKLSKSDFMIEDIKNRVNSRQNTLNNEKLELDNELFKYDTQLKLLKQQLDETLKEKESYSNIEYENEINYYEDKIIECNEVINTKRKDFNFVTLNLTRTHNLIKDIQANKTKDLECNFNSYSEKKTKLLEEKLKTEVNIANLKTEINRLNSITDICPTCGQKIPNVIKPDTDIQMNDLEKFNLGLNLIQEDIKKCDALNLNYINEINNKYNTELNKYEEQINTLTDEVEILQTRLTVLYRELNSNQKILEELKTKKTFLIDTLEKLNTKIDNIKLDIFNINKNISIIENKRTNNLNHLDIIKKIDTLIKRDFRGYLLENVISYISERCKDYCQFIFGSTDFNFIIDGNDLLISYCNKSYESLSGGEKQKVDIMLQLAIRDMLVKYLDFSCNILIFDEIFDNLDSKSTSNVLNLISNKLSDIESIFIISHHSDELDIPYDTELIIEKSQQGISSVIKQENCII